MLKAHQFIFLVMEEKDIAQPKGFLRHVWKDLLHWKQILDGPTISEGSCILHKSLPVQKIMVLSIPRHTVWGILCIRQKKILIQPVSK